MPDGNELEDNKEKQSEDSQKKSVGHAKKQAVEMWDEINKSNSKDKRNDLKEDIPDEPIVPINPFDSMDSSVKPNTTEEEKVGGEYNENDEDVEEDLIGEAEEELPIEPIAPINPFDGRAFGSKPLDEVRNVKEENVVVEEKKSADEIGHSMEGKDLSSENINPESDDSQKNEAELGEIVDSPSVVMDSSSVINTSLGLAAESKSEEIDDFKEEIWHILEQAGITKTFLVWVLILFLVAAVALTFFFSGSNGGDVGIEDVDSEVHLVQQEALGVLSSYIFGLEFKPLEIQPIGYWGDDSGIFSAFLFGLGDNIFSVKFVENIKLLRKMENAYDTDVYALIDMSTNRREALMSHISEIEILISDANKAMMVLDEEMDFLSLEYAGVVEERDLAEGNFFINLDLLQGELAYDHLDIFDRLSQNAIAIKTKFNAKSSVRDMLFSALSFLEPRYEDIVTNDEALLQGVKVFDIPGSDIDAIIPLEN